VAASKNSSVGSKESSDLCSHSYPRPELAAIHFQLAALPTSPEYEISQWVKMQAITYINNQL
jgi:hypothetical protein